MCEITFLIAYILYYVESRSFTVYTFIKDAVTYSFFQLEDTDTDADTDAVTDADTVTVTDAVTDAVTCPWLHRTRQDTSSVFYTCK